ncbi:MAG TPA: trehalase family glycosidase [Lacunisphaera sp.]
MNSITRRQALSALALTGASTLLPRNSSAAEAPTASRAPVLSGPDRTQASDQLLAYFAKAAPQLLRPAKGFLAHPNISPSLPGKQYSTTLWDWDTLWTVQGLFHVARLTKDPTLRDQVALHAQGSLRIFFAQQAPTGRIPMLVTVSKADPLDALAPAPSPNSRNQAKPVFAQLALLIADEVGDAAWFAPLFDQLLKFHASWTANNLSQTGLLVWGNDVAIGNDNDPATFGRPFFSSANLLLNTLYYQDLQAAAKLAARLGRTADAAQLTTQATALGAALLKHCWDPRDRFFYTVDVQCVDKRRELINYPPGMDMSWSSVPIKFQSFTGFLPLWSGLAIKTQAAELVQANYVADQRFRADWGVRSLSSLEPMYCMNFSSNPSNWLGPVWIIVNYLTWRGLKNYGFDTEARDLADKTLKLLAQDLATNGSLNEYYHPDTGAAISHKGFLDWNLLAVEMI